MNASDVTTLRQHATLQTTLPLTSTLLTTTRTIRSVQSGPTLTVSTITSTLQVGCGTVRSYEVLAAARPVNPPAAPFAPVSTLITAYREVYSTMSTPSTTTATSTYVQLAPAMDF